MNLTELLTAVRIKKCSSNTDGVTIEHVSHDTRDMRDNTLFACVVGATVDGHDYAAQAVAHGAVAILAQHEVTSIPEQIPVIYVPDVKRALAIVANIFYNQPSSALTLIGVTGTNGKTTVSHLLEHIYREQGDKTGLIGTLYRKVGDTVYETANTTPDCLVMQQTLSEMVQQDVAVCVSEVSSHALHQGRVWGVDFNGAIFTNLTHEHLETHKTMEEYGTVKSLLFAQLGNTFKNHKPRFAVLNADDPLSETIRSRTAAEVVTYSIAGAVADFVATQVRYDQQHTYFTLQAQDERFEVVLPLLGAFNVANALAALAAAYMDGVALQDAVQALASFSGVSGRMQVIPNTAGIHAIVDYAHTPDGLEKLFETLKQFTYRRLLVMIGHDGGNRDNSIRPALGRIALDNADYVVFTAENPRDEDPQKIVTEMIAEHTGSHHEFVADRQQAIYRCIELAQPGDLVVFAGKGHESSQLFDGYAIPFDEAGYVAAALRDKERGAELLKKQAEE